MTAHQPHAPTIFTHAQLWDQYGLSDDYGERVQLMTQLLPPQAASVLDVGCGTGDILAALGTTHPCMARVGCDSALAPLGMLMAAQVPALQAGLPHLPFADRAFEVVLCLQVLEHLPDSVYAAGRTELARLADEVLIIGVPYRENLQTKTVICAHCGAHSHVDGHVRRYDERQLATLFDGFRLESTHLAGVRQPRLTRAGAFVRQAVGGLRYEPDFFVCPVCGHGETTRPQRPAVLQRVSAGLGRRLVTHRQLPYWIIAAYRRASR